MDINIGDVIGNWKVLSDKYKKDNSVAYYNDCKCICGIIRSVRNQGLKDGSTRGCGCTLNKGRFISRGIGDLSLSYFNNFKYSRTKKGKIWDSDVTIEFLWKLFQEQKGLCALSGIPIILNKRWSSQNNKRENFGENAQTASIDRIDNSKGYSTDNIQWVHKDINLMKGVLSVDRFIELSKAISNKNPNI